MTQEATSFFEAYCKDINILAHDSSLGKNLKSLEEVDFWMLVNSKAKDLKKPLIAIEIGSSVVIHFYLVKEEKDFIIQVEPVDKKAFFGLLEDYSNHVD